MRDSAPSGWRTVRFLALPLFALTSTACNADSSPATHTVEMAADRFGPAVVAAQVDDRIVFYNNASLVHDVELSLTDSAGPSDSEWVSGDLFSGQMAEWVPTVVGTYRIRCRYHGDMGMVGVLHVEG